MKIPSVFELDFAHCVCSHVQSRKELNGEEKVLAADIKLVWKTDNNALAMLHPRMKSSFYDPAEGTQEDLAGKDHRPSLIFGNLEPLKLGARYRDCKFRIGVPGKPELTFDACKANKFLIALHDGGHVTITFRVQCHPNEIEIGKLDGMIQSEVVCHLEGAVPEAPGAAGDDE